MPYFWVIQAYKKSDWSEIDISTQMLRLTARVSGKAFVGTGLHRSEEWIDISCNVSPHLVQMVIENVFSKC